MGPMGPWVSVNSMGWVQNLDAVAFRDPTGTNKLKSLCVWRSNATLVLNWALSEVGYLYIFIRIHWCANCTAEKAKECTAKSWLVFVGHSDAEPSGKKKNETLGNWVFCCLTMQVGVETGLAHDLPLSTGWCSLAATQPFLANRCKSRTRKDGWTVNSPNILILGPGLKNGLRAWVFNCFLAIHKEKTTQFVPLSCLQQICPLFSIGFMTKMHRLPPVAWIPTLASVIFRVTVAVQMVWPFGHAPTDFWQTRIYHLHILVDLVFWKQPSIFQGNNIQPL